ncbi:MAG: hypothetical protein WEA04_01080 [Candidatus Andersenbacteria bacterium]
MHPRHHNYLLLVVRGLFIVGGVVLLGGLLMPAGSASADHTGTFHLLPACNPIPGQSDSCGVKHLVELAINVYNFLLGMAAAVALLFIIIGGVRMLIYSFTEAPETELQSAKYTVTRAVVGLVIVIAAFLIVETLIQFLGGEGIQGIINSLTNP